MKRLFSLASTLSALAISFSLTTPASANLWECGERSNLPMEGRNYCAAGDFRLADAKLQKVLDTLLRKHKDTYGDASDLINAQRGFVAYRERQCAAENKRIEEEQYHPMVVAQCKTRITNRRIDELKRMQ